MLTMDHTTITYRETPLPLALRLFIAFIGLSCGLGIPAAWLANASLSLPWVALALLAVVVAVSLTFGAALAGLALVSTTDLLIDPSADMVIRTRRGPLLNDVTHIPRRSIGLPELIMREAEDGPFPLLRLALPNGKRQEMVNFANRAEAEFWQGRIAAALGA